MSQHWVSFSAEINPQTTEGLISTLAALHNQGATEVNLLFATPGGSVMHGMAIYNTARSMPFKLITWNMGNVDSIGNVIFLAGAERYACPLSTFMFHGVGFDVPGGIRMEEPFLKERLQTIEADHKRIGSVIGTYSSIDEGDVVHLFEKASTKDAPWAQSVGIINAIREPEIPKGVPVHSLVFKR
ncbi:MAG TPA: ATP-dependent Clp protease proteolytic subunit [Sphingomicrobium sp.]|nr:ATP-dependent Clp protease proteolytic subunit [Sphingomicrobium sp.]